MIDTHLDAPEDSVDPDAVTATTSPPGQGWVRHPADVARLVAALAGLAVMLGLTAADPDLVRGISRDLARLAARLPDPVEDVAAGLAQMAALVAPVALLVGLVANRLPRLAVVLAGAGLVAGIAAAGLQSWLDDSAPPEALPRLEVTSWITGAAFPSPAYLAGLAAVITVLVPNLPGQWRRPAWWTLLGAATLRLLTAVALPLHIGVTLLLGIAIGSLVLLAFGAPRRRTRRSAVVTALSRAGLSVGSVERTERDVRFVARGASGSVLTVDVFDRDGRDADLFFRAVAAARARGFDDNRPGWSATRVVQHEALVTLLASGSGSHAPEVVAVAATDDGAGVLVTRSIGGTSFDELSLESLTDEVLAATWSAVATLHRARIAHRHLHLGSLRLLPDGSVAVTDLRASQLTAGDSALAADVAELMVSLAVRIGPERAVSSAGVLGHDALGDALPLLQPLALTALTRRRLKEVADDQPDLLDKLRQEVQDAAGLEKHELAELQRLSVGRIVALVGAVVLVYVAFAFATNWSSISTALQEADWSYAPMVLLMAALGFPAGALSLMGAVTNRLPLLETTHVMLAQSFLNRFTPANAGGMALRARYLQRQGVELSVAAASVGITSMASGAMQVVLLISFLSWAGETGGTRFDLPDASAFAVVLLVVLVAGAVVWVTPLGARLRAGRLAVSARQVLAEVRSLASRPSKLALLFGGAVAGKLTTLVAFAYSAWAFDVSLPFAQLSALYMTANTVASAAPTPGGVGAIEAALIAVLSGAGVEPAVAVSVVLLFRFATYWLPVPFAWLALRGLRKTDIV